MAAVPYDTDSGHTVRETDTRETSMTDLVPVTRTIVDDRHGLEAALRARHRAGRLVTEPHRIDPIRLASGQYAVRVVVLEPAPRHTVRPASFDERHPILGPCLKALAFGIGALLLVASVLAGAGLLGYLAIGGAGIAAIGKWLGAGIMTLAILAWLARSRSSNHGDHKGMGWHYTKCK
jgi:hypothetical protein